jgi:hypothetical protein
MMIGQKELDFTFLADRLGLNMLEMSQKFKFRDFFEFDGVVHAIVSTQIDLALSDELLHGVPEFPMSIEQSTDNFFIGSVDFHLFGNQSAEFLPMLQKTRLDKFPFIFWQLNYFPFSMFESALMFPPSLNFDQRVHLKKVPS